MSTLSVNLNRALCIKRAAVRHGQAVATSVTHTYTASRRHRRDRLTSRTTSVILVQQCVLDGSRRRRVLKQY